MTPATDALPAIAGRRSARVVARSLFALTKPRIIELLLVTQSRPCCSRSAACPRSGCSWSPWSRGACAAGSANTINCYIDRDIDAIMRRTSRRPLNGKGREAAVIKPAEALVFGILLGAVSTVLLGTLVNWLSAALADTAILFYVFVYTLGLKRRTPSNIVIGGAAGCPGAHRLVGRDRPGQPARGGPVRGDLLLDPAALLGAGHEVPRRLRRGPGAHAAGGRLTRRGRPEDPLLLLRDGGWPPSPSRPTPAGCTRPRRSALGGWFLAEAHRLRSRVAAMTFDAGPAPAARPDQPRRHRPARRPAGTSRSPPPCRSIPRRT